MTPEGPPPGGPGPLAAGVRLGPYRIECRIGSGGMGEVYKAEDTRLGRLVALKFLRPEVSGDVEAIERFRVEAHATSALNHPNICTVYEVGESEGRTFIAMELLEGQTFRQLLHGKSLEPRKLLSLAIQIADGLEAAHARGIVHRDIKPENLFVDATGRVKILDFGLAKLQAPAGPKAGVSGESSLLTQSVAARPGRPGLVLGTLAYMSPEQIQGEDLDCRTDLFSLGAVLFEMVSGRPAFGGRTYAEIAAAIVGETPTLPPAAQPRLRPALQEIVGKALEKNRGLRYQHAADFGTDLKRLRRDLDVDRPGRAVALPPVPAAGAGSLGRSIAFDLLKAAVFAALVFGVHDLIERRASGKYLQQFQVAFVQENVQHGPLDEANFEAGGRRLPLVVDIAALHPEKLQRSDRRMLDLLVDELRRDGATAIGLDLVFDDLQPEDFRYLQKWTAQKNVRVGIYRRSVERREAWLGRGEFASLAAGIALPRDDPQKAYFYTRRWFLKTDLATENGVGPDDCVGAGAAARCREDLIQLPGAMWLLSERQRISVDELTTLSDLEARLKASLEDMQSRSTTRPLGGELSAAARSVAELGEYSIDYSYLKEVQRDIITLSPGQGDGGFEAPIAALAAYRSRVANRAVFVGDLEDPIDHSCPAPGMTPVSGVLIHACALATLNRGMVFHLADTPGPGSVVGGILLLVALIVGLRVWYRRVPALQRWPFQYLEILAFGSLSVVVSVAFIWRLRAFGVVWPDCLWLCGALLAHPFVSEPLYRTATATRGMVLATLAARTHRMRRV